MYTTGRSSPCTSPLSEDVHLQSKMEGKVRCVEQRLPTVSLLQPRKHHPVLQRPVDQIWATLLGEITKRGWFALRSRARTGSIKQPVARTASTLFWSRDMGRMWWLLFSSAAGAPSGTPNIYLPRSNSTLLQVGSRASARAPPRCYCGLWCHTDRQQHTQQQDTAPGTWGAGKWRGLQTSWVWQIGEEEVDMDSKLSLLYISHL